MKKTFKCRVPKAEIGKKIIPVIFMAKLMPEDAELNPEITLNFGITYNYEYPKAKMCFADADFLDSIIKDDETYPWYSVSLECVENEDGTYNIDVPMNNKVTRLMNILPSEELK